MNYAFYANKNVLVTGGCGFIGSHVVEQLINNGAHVTVLDNLSTGKIHNIASVQKDVSLIQDDIQNQEVCDQATQNKDIVFHLAALASVPYSINDPRLCHATNVTGTFNLLEGARKNNIQRFVFSSSAAVYGQCSKPCSEDMRCNPTSPYGFSKLIGEMYCQLYAQQYSIPTVALRYFNVFGPRQDYTSRYAGIYAKLSHALKTNKPITIFGNGLQQRDFIAVEKVVEANLLVGSIDQKYVMGNTFNVATGRSITLLELLETLKKNWPSYDHPVLFDNARVGDIAYSGADCAKLNSLFQHIESF